MVFFQSIVDVRAGVAVALGAFGGVTSCQLSLEGAEMTLGVSFDGSPSSRLVELDSPLLVLKTSSASVNNRCMCVARDEKSRSGIGGLL